MLILIEWPFYPWPETDFRFLPQNSIMSKHKTLSREEMEIHQVLSPASGPVSNKVLNKIL